MGVGVGMASMLDFGELALARWWRGLDRRIS